MLTESYSFPRSVRLLTAEAYANVFTEPFRSTDAFFTILSKKTDVPSARLGLAIAKKNLKKAHERNLVKRITRESFRLHQDILQGLDIVVLVKPRISLDNRSLLHDSLKRHWQRIARQCKQS